MFFLLKEKTEEFGSVWGRFGGDGLFWTWKKELLNCFH